MSRAGWLSPCPARGAGWRRYTIEELLPIAEREARALGAVRPSDLSGLDDTEVPFDELNFAKQHIILSLDGLELGLEASHMKVDVPMHLGEVELLL
mgnify:CR=1 FL=1